MSPLRLVLRWTESGKANETVEPKEVPLCFIKYLLDEGYVESLCEWVNTNAMWNQVMTPEKRRCYSSISTMPKSARVTKILSKLLQLFVAWHPYL
jgi:hypothetical protein